MKTLHYHLYEEGKIGMCNMLMSVENALLLAKLTDRDKIIFYLKYPLYNSKKTIFDLYDIDFNYEINYGTVPNCIKLEHDFHNACIYLEEPNKGFLNDRTKLIDINKYINIEEYSTLNSNTLSFYSYLFYLNSNRKELQDWLKNALKPKEVYLQAAKDIVEQLKNIYGEYNSIHVRRGDYLNTSNLNKNIECKDLDISFDNNKLLVVHSDEFSDYFSCLKEKYSNIWFIDSALQYEDNAEKGLISLLVASYSSDFIGTMLSTYTAYIQRYRMYNGLKEEFKYLYSQSHNIKLINNKFKENSFGTNTWNRIDLHELKPICFWFREWQESYYKNSLKQELKIVPNFIKQQEIDFILSQLNDTEYFARENRNRTVLNTQEGILKDLIQRACIHLNLNYNNVEHGLQVFKQYKGGETFLHTDSIYEDAKGKRVTSVLFYLNDDFTGSYIDFPYLGVRISPSKGTMINYPLINEWNEQDILWSHSASVITKGYKVMAYFSVKEK